MNRNAAIDVSRAIAVMLVTIFHVSSGPIAPSYTIGDFDLFAFMSNGWVGVGIFFIISGYCMGMSTKREFSEGLSIKGYFRYTLKRFMRIAPPYYLSIAVWVFIITVYKMVPKPTAFKDIVTHLTFTHNLFTDTFFSISGVYWSIGVEMQFYLILPFIVVLCRSFFTSCIILMITLFISVITYSSSLDITYKWGLLNYLVLFMYGWMLYSYNSRVVDFINRTRVIYIVLPILILLLLYKGSGYGNHQKMYELSISFLYGIIMVKMNDFLSQKEHSSFINVLLLIGKASFSIYLYNYIYALVAPRSPNFIVLMFMFVGVLGFGVLMYLLVEENTEKVRAFLFKKKQS